MRIFKMDFLSMASILNFLYSILCFLLFYFFTSKEIKSNRNALLSTILLILFPFHYYFSMYYSEALYLSLVLLCFLMIQLNKNLLLSIFLVLLVLVRPNGMFMTIPLFIYFIEKRYGINSSIFLNRKWQDFLPILSFVSAPLTLMAYCIYLNYMTGDYIAFINARKGWCLDATFPWEPFYNIKEWKGRFYAVYYALFIVLWLTNWKKLRISFHVLILINMILPLTSGIITLPRYISAIFVFWIILGGLLGNLELKTNRRLIPFIFILLFAGQLWSFTFWLEWHPFSY